MKLWISVNDLGWYNTERFMHRLGRVPPVEAEVDYYATTDAANPAVHTS